MPEDKIIVMRLVTGEFIVAKLISIDGTCENENYEVEDPLQFEIVQNAPGQFGMPVRPLIPLAKPGDKITLKERDIMFMVDEPAEPIVEQYREALTPEASKILKPGDPGFQAPSQ